MNQGRDYRVNLDYVYIPKNAYEDYLFFEIVLKCKQKINPADLSRKLFERDNKDNKNFWEKRKRHYKNAGSAVEAIRDILDFATYCGMVDKRFIFGNKRNLSEYEITPFGELVCEKFLNNDETVIKDLIQALLNYKIGNSQINIIKYYEFTSFRVRPFFILLKILYLFEEKWGKRNIQFEPYDLAYVILTTKNEDDSSIEQAIDILYKISTKKRTLQDYLNDRNTNINEFKIKVNNCVTRLFNWSYYCGLLDCKTSKDDIIEFFDKWDNHIRINKILGLSKIGHDVYSKVQNTYYYWERNLHPNEVIILKILNNIKEGVNRGELFEELNKYVSCDQIRFERQISRLKAIFNLKQEGKILSLNKFPIFDSPSSSLIKLSNDISKKIKPNISIYPELYLKNVEFATESQKTVDFLQKNELLNSDELNMLLNNGIERYFFDYHLLALGDSILKKRYSDIRFTFELKTAELFKRMNFKVQSFGQKARGTSSVDILSFWSRLNEQNEREDNITVIECKSSKNPYNLSLNDISDRERQIGNIMNSDNYSMVRTLIRSLLFVSSSFGNGDNESKMDNIENKILNRLYQQMKIAIIGSKELIHLYIQYKNNPQKFEDYNLLNLFRNQEIHTRDIDKIFN